TTLLCPDGRARVYPGGAAFAQFVYAVEKSASATDALGQNSRLRGFATYTDLLEPYRTQYLPFHHTPVGQNVTLTLDKDLQQTAMDALHEYAVKVRGQHSRQPQNKGAAVLLNANTGEVLAAVSLPTFDPATLTPETWAALQQQSDGPVFNRVLAGLYPPGSSFKIVTATAGLAHGLGNTIIICHHTDTNVVWRFGGKNYSRRKITDEEGFVPHGVTDMAKALRVSCNVYFAHLGIKLGATALGQTGRKQFELAHLPPPAKLGEDLPDCAYGQGAVLVTPLEMGRVAQAVANNGRLLPVDFVKTGAVASSGTAALTPEQAAQMRQMLSAVTQPGGTASGVFDGLPFSVAGKTGSAQNAQGQGRAHSWFVGFAPADHPTLAFACIVENAGFGRSAAAPVCREMLRKAL
ncbi:MAG: penicillin-binding transpeptidase domain-containing protein, partial [Armatimonadota bacterium]|nr:penicillin-binding transpeptidase domain-containing protein [Armatimonadota bacterium]